MEEKIKELETEIEGLKETIKDREDTIQDLEKENEVLRDGIKETIYNLKNLI